ncbi:MAG: class I SAM-dependent methyltransferase [Thermoguttaceae bacterium]|nr:class I SAM-dependent methyltransferase [Thermoguttaceae bacterium]MDW8078344.1 class I SAM-dependent methyltransferase [Thermoguttaceae bacterium]
MPLWSRAVESVQPRPILCDPMAVAIVERLDYDFERFRRRGVDPVGYCSRAAIIDQLVREWLCLHPAGNVVELGVGLDTRFDRLDNGDVCWWELDLPEVIGLRRHFFSETPRRRFLAYSLLDPEWTQAIPDRHISPVLIVAEGVFYFFRHKVLLDVFARLSREFPGGRIIFDCQSPWFLRYSRWRHPLRTSALVWSVGSVERLARQIPRVQSVRWIGFGDSPYYDGHLNRFPLHFRILRRWFPAVRGAFKIVEFTFAKPASPADEADG